MITGAHETISLACRLALLTEPEARQLALLLDGAHPLAALVARADSIHAHVKVDDVDAVPRDALLAAGGRVERAETGYLKVALPTGVSLIVSSIPISEDDLGSAIAARPFLDHVGIDVRVEDVVTRALFDGVPSIASEHGWSHVPQGGAQGAVACCHVSVSAKHWVFASDARPIEIALGPLVIQEGRGIDLRPSDPSRTAAACCAPAPALVTSLRRR